LPSLVLEDLYVSYPPLSKAIKRYTEETVKEVGLNRPGFTGDGLVQ